MKKWEFAVLVGFFAIFLILFLSVKLPWEAETSKIGEFKIIDDVSIWPQSLLVSEKLDIEFRKSKWGETVGYKEYEAGDGWKFIILDLQVTNHGDKEKSFSVGLLEDKDGMDYYYYHLVYESGMPSGIPYHELGLPFEYKIFVTIQPKDSEFISIAYKIPVNAVPEKFHYSIHSINNSHSWNGEIILKK